MYIKNKTHFKIWKLSRHFLASLLIVTQLSFFIAPLVYSDTLNVNDNATESSQVQSEQVDSLIATSSSTLQTLIPPTEISTTSGISSSIQTPPITSEISSTTTPPELTIATTSPETASSTDQILNIDQVQIASTSLPTTTPKVVDEDIPNKSSLDKNLDEYQHTELSNESINLSAPEKPQTDPFTINSKTLSSLPIKFIPLNLSKDISLEKKITY